MTMPTTTVDVVENTSAAICAVDGQAVSVNDRWPIGTVVALHFVAHGRGPRPEAPDFIEAVNLDLIRLGDPWRVTERGQAILAEYGWL